MNNEFKTMLARNNWVILDTETTGKDRPFEICQIAIIDHTGKVLLDELVKPKNSISEDAFKIHQISNDMVKDAPNWMNVSLRVKDIIEDKDVITYNAKFDRSAFHQSDEAWDVPHYEWKEHATWHCAMEAYAAFWGEINPSYGTPKWQTLSNAIRQQGLEVGNAHNALGDCLMTYALISRVFMDGNGVKVGQVQKAPPPAQKYEYTTVYTGTFGWGDQINSLARDGWYVLLGGNAGTGLTFILLERPYYG